MEHAFFFFAYQFRKHTTISCLISGPWLPRSRNSFEYKYGEFFILEGRMLYDSEILVKKDSMKRLNLSRFSAEPRAVLFN